MDNSSPARRQVLLLGANGHLGRAIAQGLTAAGFAVHGLARRKSGAEADEVQWHFGDLRQMTDEAAWRDLAAGKDVIVNAAGALQDGLRDDLEAVHVTALAALCAAATPGTLLVQISAPGVSSEASTHFFRSKSRGDAIVQASGLRWVILRPAVVVSREAYGGSALLRALAAFPGFIPAVTPARPLRTVAIDDVVAAVRDAAEGRLPAGSDLVLADARERSLSEVLRLFRRWLGLRDAPVVAVPRVLARPVSALADAAGALGWRSPMRSTAIQVASDGVDAAPGYPCRSLEDTLRNLPSTVQERWFARLYLLKAPCLLTLSLFWLASGVIGLLRMADAMAVLTRAGLGETMALLAVTGGALADIALGGLVLVRRLSSAALMGMLGMTALYLACASVLTPALWLDPLGPLVKSVPAAMLCLLALAMDPER